eukprot:6180056-Pleurochrysis_carterae.AAC.5
MEGSVQLGSAVEKLFLVASLCDREAQRPKNPHRQQQRCDRPASVLQVTKQYPNVVRACLEPYWA